MLSLQSGTSIPGKPGRDSQAAQAGSHQRCLRRREISRARDLFYKADERHREDQQNARQDTSHSSGLVDSGSCEASHELFRAHDVKSTVNLKKVGCWPARPSVNGVNATRLALQGALLTSYPKPAVRRELAISLPQGIVCKTTEINHSRTRGLEKLETPFSLPCPNPLRDWTLFVFWVAALLHGQLLFMLSTNRRIPGL